MSIKILFFASLREDLGKSEDAFSPSGTVTVREVWQGVVNGPLPERILCAVNMEYASPDAPVQDGDEVAFFPPVTGGSHAR